jgi:stress-induced morphogen
MLPILSGRGIISLFKKEKFMTIQDSDVVDAITKSIPDASVTLKALDCSKKGYFIKVHSASFKNQSLIEQHKRIKNALAEFLHTEELHAVTIETTS